MSRSTDSFDSNNADAPGPTTHFVISQDGTKIGYNRYSRRRLHEHDFVAEEGGVRMMILISPAMSTAYHYSELALSLAVAYEVVVPDRRGRGMSPRLYDQGHQVKRDIEDIQAVIKDATNNNNNDVEAGVGVYLFGLSSGAVIVLETAAYLLSIPTNAQEFKFKLSGIIIYEPPFYPIDQPLDPTGVQALSNQLENEDYAGALNSALSLSATIPWWIAYVPLWIKKLLAGAILAADGKWNISGGDGSVQNPHIRTLLPSVQYDFNVVLSAQRKGRMAQLAQSLTRTMRLGVLLLKGSNSPVYLRQAVDQINHHLTMPDTETSTDTDLNSSRNARTKMVDLDGMDHSGPWNKTRGGDPNRVAQLILDFF